MKSMEQRTADLARRMPHVPLTVVTRMQVYLREAGTLPQRGMSAAVEDFYARLDAAGLPPEQATEEVFREVGTSRTRFRALIAALGTGGSTRGTTRRCLSNALRAGWACRRRTGLRAGPGRFPISIALCGPMANGCASWPRKPGRR